MHLSQIFTFFVFVTTSALAGNTYPYRPLQTANPNYLKEEIHTEERKRI